MFSHFVSALVAATLLAILGAGPGRAHEGHDHGPPVQAAPADVPPRAEAQSEAFELVAVAQGTTLVLYLDRFATNQPVDGATIEVETPAGPATAKGEDAGIYRLDAAWLAKGGHLDLIVTVTDGGEVAILPISLDVPAARAAAAGLGPAGIQGLAARFRAVVEPAVLMAGGAGLLAGIALMAFGRRRRSAVALAATAVLALSALPAWAHEGHDHGGGAAPAATSGDATPSTVRGEQAQRQPDGAVFVPKSIQRIFGIRTEQVQPRTFRRANEMPGRVIPDPNASGLVQSATGGRLSPPPGGFPLLGAKVKEGDVLAYVTPPIQTVDISDLRQRQGELDQQIAIVERRLARFQTLAPSGAVARAQLEEAKLELDGLRDRRTALDRVRDSRVALVAPVSGIVAEGVAVAGQVVQSDAVIFQVIDPAKLWIEALSFEALTAPGAASARTADGKALALSYQGSAFAARNQSVRVHFAIAGEIGGLRTGQFVTVMAETGEPRQGLSVPRSAVVRAANGQDFVFEHISAERFEPRPVRVEPLDADRVLVLAGLDAGKRIVTQGAELLDQVH